jgi:hypothetical protein
MTQAMTQAMTQLQKIQALAAEAAAVARVDMSQTGTGGGGERIVLETGNYLARFVEYVEKGVQKNNFDPSKQPAAKVRLGFAVFPFEEVNGVRKVSENPQFIRTQDMTISNHEKAGLKKVYNRLNYRNDATKTHVAMFLGDAYLIGVTKKVSKKGSEYNAIDTNDIKPAIDPMSGQAYGVPQVEDSVYRVFMFDYPTQETWDALFIEGSNDDGTTKNFIQEEILGAVNYNGSALQLLLEGSASIPAPVAEDVPWTEPAALPAEIEVQIPETPAVPAAPVAPVVPQA